MQESSGDQPSSSPGRTPFGAARSWADSVLKYPDDVVGKRSCVWVLIFITNFLPSLPFKVLGVKLLTENLSCSLGDLELY